MRNKTRLLIADANHNYRRLMYDILSREDDIELCGSTSDGFEALAIIGREAPDVVLTDVILRGIDGLELLRRTTEIGRRPCVVFVSGFSSERVVDEAFDLGASYFLAKPCDTSVLLTRIRELAELPQRARRELTGGTPNTATLRIDTMVTDVLCELGLPAHVKGYPYLRRAIRLVILNKDALHGITKVIYPELSRTFSSSPGSIERAIRHAIDICWDRGDINALQHYFGYTISAERGKPTNREFVARIADLLTLRLREAEQSVK